MARTMVSPSRVSTRRSVVCVAGCCGPKLSVQRYSLSVPGTSSSTLSINSSGIPGSSLRANQLFKVVPLAMATQRIILAQRKTDETIGHQNATQIRMFEKHDAVHVVNFALHPV